MTAKTDIMAVIAKTDDQNMKAVLILMLAVLEEISDEIRAMRSDEVGLREAVLNGHTHVHDAHHEWVCEKIRQEKEEFSDDKHSRRKIRDALIERALWAALVVLLASLGWLH